MGFKGLSRQAVLASIAPDNVDDGMIARIRAMGERLGQTTFEAQSSLVRSGDVERLAEISCPTLIIAGSEDQLRGLDEAYELREGIQGSRLTVIEGSGHMIQLERPAELLAAMLAWVHGL
jgi:pimeloyl-ACP methyl ester carboxylesterase